MFKVAYQKNQSKSPSPGRWLAALLLCLGVTGAYGAYLTRWLEDQKSNQGQTISLPPGETRTEESLRSGKALLPPEGWSPKALAALGYLGSEGRLDRPVKPWVWSSLPEEFAVLSREDFPPGDDSLVTLVWGLSVLARRASSPEGIEDLSALKDRLAADILRGATAGPLRVLEAWETGPYPRDPEILAWMGSGLTMEALKTDNVFEKMDRVKEGAQALDLAMNRSPDNGVVLAVRSSTYLTLPAFFKEYRKQGFQDLVNLGERMKQGTGLTKTGTGFLQEPWNPEPETWGDIYALVQKDPAWDLQQRSRLQTLNWEISK